jgi:cell division initiation protein
MTGDPLVRLTPLEIRKQVFSRRRLGGVDAEEVQDFLNLIATELEEVVRENALLRERLEASNQKVAEFRSMEETLRRTLVRAEQLSSESEDNARREGDLLLRQAQLRAERVLDDARNRLKHLAAEVDELQKKKDIFLHRFRSLVEMQLELLDQHGPDYDEVSSLADDAREALLRHMRPVVIPDDDSSAEWKPTAAKAPPAPAVQDAPLTPPPGLIELGTDDDV